ncbi:MAG: exodeoxyribonuclease VII large subunit [Holosporaceae bacterium]|nr:exodeoxyribonuclease VII large subunit [Holosporaceae bacterium]
MEEYTVSRLSNLIKRAVEQSFRGVLVKGEISGLKIPSAGHAYFVLKDAEAVLGAVCWKGTLQKQKIKLENGMEVRCFGNVGTYQQQSNYQLIVERIEHSGVGELLKQLEERRRKLTAEGLFDISRKKPIPVLPKLIGIITSATGAVIEDMKHRILQRFPREILLWPVAVQGTEASGQIVAAIEGMNSDKMARRPDVLIVARGGGSFEELMPFNEECVVRAVVASKIPIISAIGHETDTTLIDFAADLRAPTPTAAAEFAVPERVKLQATLNGVFSQLNSVVLSNLEKKRLFLQSNKILNIQGVISVKVQCADFAFDRIISIMNNCIARRKISCARLVVSSPVLRDSVGPLYQKLRFRFSSVLEQCRNQFLLASAAIESNSYVRILQKGFAFVESEKFQPVTSVADAEKHSALNLTFSDGHIRVRRIASQVDLF